MSKSRLVKVIFTNSIAQCMRNVFTFYLIQVSLEKTCSKLGIMTNVGKSRLVKVIVTNIIAQCMRNVFTFY